MNNLHFLALAAVVLASDLSGAEPDKARQLFASYYEEYLQLFPVTATMIGDHRYDDRLGNELSDEHRAKQASLARRYTVELKAMDRSKLSAEDRLSCDILQSDLDRMSGALQFPDHWLPVGQMDDLPTGFALLASGESIHPFKTVSDYEKFLGRMKDFAVCVDTAIA
ncbi:DUF885 family protein, partial [bacterium]|nr:DUF885 family protein [bacterium]